jgi:hypothetical protein
VKGTWPVLAERTIRAVGALLGIVVVVVVVVAVVVVVGTVVVVVVVVAVVVVVGTVVVVIVAVVVVVGTVVVVVVAVVVVVGTVVVVVVVVATPPTAAAVGESDSGPPPFAFDARTVKVNDDPVVSPLTVKDVVAPSSATVPEAAPLRYLVTV